MKYPCGIIKDILPLYIDEVCTPESTEIVETHLSECTACKNLYNTMKSSNSFADLCPVAHDSKMADSLKQVKHSINKKIRNIALCAIGAVALCLGAYLLLFQSPIKDVPLEDITISADVYSLEELMNQGTEALPDTEAVVKSQENDTSPRYKVTVPGLGRFTITEETIKKCKYVSAISIESKYFLKKVEQTTNDGIIYISKLKTTVLNNTTSEFSHKSMTLEFQEINKIVFVDSSGAETVLWSK